MLCWETVLKENHADSHHQIKNVIKRNYNTFLFNKNIYHCSHKQENCLSKMYFTDETVIKVKTMELTAHFHFAKLLKFAVNFP